MLSDVFGSDSPGLFALRKLSHPPTTEASPKCVHVPSWTDVLSLLCEDEPKAMLTVVIVQGDWSLCACVEVLVFGWFSAEVCHKLLSCVKPLRCFGCRCKHSLALFNISSNLTLFSQRCLFDLRVWVNGEIAESVSLIYLLVAAFLSDSLLFVLSLPCLFHFPPLLRHQTYILFLLSNFINSLFAWLYLWLKPVKASSIFIQLVVSVSLSKSQHLFHNCIITMVFITDIQCVFFFLLLLEPLRQLWLVSSCHGNRCCRAGHGVLPLSWKQVQLPCISTKQQQCQNLFCPSVCMQ